MSEMELKITQVDAFTDKAFSGNPAAVCVTTEPLAEPLMQAIASEMNLSETAFLHPLDSEPDTGGFPNEEGYRLRWFTPLTEVDLCGHATLASAHILWSEGHLAAGEPAKFKTKSGWLTAKQGADGWIEMDFPAMPVEHSAYVMPQLVKSLCCGGNIRAVSKNQTNFLVEIQTEHALRGLKPDFVQMNKLPVQGVIATAPAAGDDCDFVSRYFAPSVGVNEDPVTGSAHASLAPYWKAKLKKSSMVARQISERGGMIRVTCEEDDRVTISGQAVTVFAGILKGQLS